MSLFSLQHSFIVNRFCKVALNASVAATERLSHQLTQIFSNLIMSFTMLFLQSYPLIKLLSLFLSIFLIVWWLNEAIFLWDGVVLKSVKFFKSKNADFAQINSHLLCFQDEWEKAQPLVKIAVTCTCNHVLFFVVGGYLENVLPF